MKSWQLADHEQIDAVKSLYFAVRRVREVGILWPTILDMVEDAYEASRMSVVHKGDPEVKP